MRNPQHPTPLPDAALGEGESVEIRAEYSAFVGRRGTIVRRERDGWIVRLNGASYTMYFGQSALAACPPRGLNCIPMR